MAIKDDVAKLSNEAQITYLDTGAPEGVTNYRTFLFIHGAAHNKCTLGESDTANCRCLGASLGNHSKGNPWNIFFSTWFQRLNSLDRR